MKTNRENSKRESLMASTLLATAFVITATRSRPHSERPYQRFDEIDAQTKSDSVRPTAIHRTRLIHRLIAAFERRFAAYFHCAIPNGLEPHDFDLSDLTR